MKGGISMKKTFISIIILLSILSICSCTNNGKRTGEIPTISVEDMVGSIKETPYENIITTNTFKLAFETYTDPQNPLQLKGGTHKDSVVLAPFKSVIVNDNKVVAPLNIWSFPVVHNDTYIGMINCDMRYSDNIEASIFGGECYANNLNTALQKGNIAIFTTTIGTYGIYEDNTIVTLEATDDYKGTLSFEEINNEYNLITQNSFNNIVYSSN